MPVFKVLLGQGSTAFAEHRVHFTNYGGKCRGSHHVFEERNFERIEVSKISSQDRMLQCTVEQTLDESCAPRERVQQRTAKARLSVSRVCIMPSQLKSASPVLRACPNSSRLVLQERSRCRRSELWKNCPANRTRSSTRTRRFPSSVCSRQTELSTT